MSFRKQFKEPAPPTGADQLSVWGRLFQKYVDQFLPKDILGANWKPDANGGGSYVLPKIPAIPSQSKFQQFKVVSDGGDYYNCNTWDGMNAGAAVIKVAKHQDIMCILPTANPAGGAWPQKTIRGVTYTYTYNPTAGMTTDGVNVVEYTRDVSGDDSSSETDEITPCLNVGDIITGFSTSFTSPATLVGVSWQALADGRAWAAEPS